MNVGVDMVLRGYLYTGIRGGSLLIVWQAARAIVFRRDQEGRVSALHVLSIQDVVSVNIYNSVALSSREFLSLV